MNQLVFVNYAVNLQIIKNLKLKIKNCRVDDQSIFLYYCNMYFIEFLIGDYSWTEPVDLETYVSYDCYKKILQIFFYKSSPAVLIYEPKKYRQTIRVCKNDILTTFGEIIEMEPNCGDEYIKDVVFPKLEILINRIKTYIALEKME